MSTFLALCQRLRQEAGISGTGPYSVLGQVGESKKVVDWIATAYQDIQNLHSEWDFLRTEVSFDTTAGLNNYTKATISVPEYGEWVSDSFRSYLTASGVASEQFMNWCNWMRFRDTYVFGSNRTLQGFPRYLAQKPDKSLIMYPTPNDEYTINGEYFQRAHAMAADADEPLIPTEYRLVIVWRALMFYAGSYNAPELYAVGEAEYKRILRRLEHTNLQPIELGGPLA